MGKHRLDEQTRWRYEGLLIYLGTIAMVLIFVAGIVLKGFDTIPPWLSLTMIFAPIGIFAAMMLALAIYVLKGRSTNEYEEEHD